jgi:hypothetical protein
LGAGLDVPVQEGQAVNGRMDADALARLDGRDIGLSSGQTQAGR